MLTSAKMHQRVRVTAGALAGEEGRVVGSELMEDGWHIWVDIGGQRHWLPSRLLESV